jgi:hypothetical protein
MSGNRRSSALVARVPTANVDVVSLRPIRRRFVDAPDSWGARRRGRRLTWLAETFPDLPDMSILDLGGWIDTWARSPRQPRAVHIVNLEVAAGDGYDFPDWASIEAGDACALPEHIRGTKYDLVFSNSVIEHVGGHERRLRFAETVLSFGTSYWVQTPYRYFPIEPHWVAPGLQFLPVRARSALAHRWPLSHSKPRSRREAEEAVLWTELIDRSQLQHYFPDATIRNERLAGLTKSLIAYRVS